MLDPVFKLDPPWRPTTTKQTLLQPARLWSCFWCLHLQGVLQEKISPMASYVSRKSGIYMCSGIQKCVHATTSVLPVELLMIAQECTQLGPPHYLKLAFYPQLWVGSIPFKIFFCISKKNFIINIINFLLLFCICSQKQRVLNINCAAIERVCAKSAPC